MNLFIDTITMVPPSDGARTVANSSPFLLSGGMLLLIMLFDRIINDIRVLPKWILLILIFSSVPRTFIATFLTSSEATNQCFTVIAILARLYEITMLLLIVAAKKLESFLKHHGL